MWTDSLREFVAGGFSGIWLVTEEPIEAESAIQKLGKDQSWNVLTWDIASGLKGSGVTTGTAAGDPAAAIRALSGMAGTTLLVANGFHRFLQSAEIVALLGRELAEGKACQRFVVVLAPAVAIPPELTRQMIVLEHDLPTLSDLKALALGLVEDGEVDEATVVQPEKKMNGKRFYFHCSPEYFKFLDKNGNLFPDIEVEIKSRWARVLEVLPTSQVSSSSLSKGDRIMKINDNYICDIRSLKSALRAVKKDQKMTIVYLKGDSDEEKVVEAVGGQSLGIKVTDD